MSTNVFDLGNIANSSQEKLIYFLMVAAGSGIGFAITQTRSDVLATHHIIWLIAVGMWSISFWAGIRWTINSNNIKIKNVTYLDTVNKANKEKNINPEVTNELIELISSAQLGYKATMSKLQARLKRLGWIQTSCLYCGALVYIIWHFFYMYQLC